VVAFSVAWQGSGSIPIPEMSETGLTVPDMNEPLNQGARGMMAWAGRRLWPAVGTVIRAVTMAHDQQVSMWECVLLTSGAAPLSAAGPLRWVPSLDGCRLAGSHLPAQDPSETGR